MHQYTVMRLSCSNLSIAKSSRYITFFDLGEWLNWTVVVAASKKRPFKAMMVASAEKETIDSKTFQDNSGESQEETDKLLAKYFSGEQHNPRLL